MSTSILPASASMLSPGDSLFGGNLGSSSTSNTNAASSTLDDISAQVALLQQKADQAKITNVQDFQKTVYKPQIQNRMTARDVGTLRQNDSRLNVFSSLAQGNAADFFSFKVATTGQTHFSVLTADQSEEQNLRFQILNRDSGTVVADSAADAGDAKKTYDQLKNGTYQLQSGNYVLRISRQDNSVANRSTSYNYAVQLTQGTYTKDFDTIAKDPQKGADPFGLDANSSTDSLTASLGSAVTFLQSLPPIGTSATDKLNGVLINSLF